MSHHPSIGWYKVIAEWQSKRVPQYLALNVKDGVLFCTVYALDKG
jgi:hypothetical protein